MATRSHVQVLPDAERADVLARVGDFVASHPAVAGRGRIVRPLRHELLAFVAHLTAPAEFVAHLTTPPADVARLTGPWAFVTHLTASPTGADLRAR